MTKSVPVLRFPNFEGAWKEEKAGRLCDSIVPGRNKPTEFVGDIPWITTPDIEHNGVITNSKSELGITAEEAKKVGSRIVPLNSVVISCVGELGLVALAGRELVINQQLHAFLPGQRVDYRFLMYAISTQNRYMDRVATKTAVPYMNKENCNSIPVHHPTLPEQTKIAGFLSAVDGKIQQLTRKKALLEQHKKGVMQQLFTQQIRFTRADGTPSRGASATKGKAFPEWEEISAGDLFRNHSNKNHKSDLPILAATQERGMVARDSIGIDIKSSAGSISTYKVVEPGDFVISLRSFQGGIEYSEVLGICSPAYIILKPKVPIDDVFFKNYFKKEDFITMLSNTVIGIRDGKQITYENFSNLVLQVPCLEEQQRIAGFLSALDGRVAAVAQQLAGAVRWKKGLLQQMFV